MKNRFESIDQVNNLREIQALRRLSPHEHIISLEEVLYDQPTGRLALVFELMDANLYELIRGRRHYLNAQLVKMYMWQLMKSLDHMHRKGIFHRDIKPENILIESSSDIGRGLKLADFGSCRGIYSKQPYTEYISTRWYRAPECLLTDGYYGPEMDLWGAGCVMFEITSLYPLFPGSNEVDQISRIHKVLGTPSAELLQKFKSKGASHVSFDFPSQKGVGIPQLIPHAGSDAIDLIVKLLKYDAADRISAREAMRHPYFKEAREADAKKAAESSQGVSEEQSVASSSVDPRKTGGARQAAHHGGSSKINAVLNKGLPSIGGDAHEASPSQKQATSNHSMQQYSSAHHKQQASHSKHHSHNSTLPLFNGSVGAQGSGVQSSLPPIAGGGGSTTKQDTHRSNRSLQQQPKRRKKYKTQELNKSTKRTGQEQVLRTYGLAGKTLSTDSRSEVKIDGKPAGSGTHSYNHPNRHYVQKR
eukprot:CAMPEP_0116979002 /NCGR_PEP_ID=MMETSP0467-20121206/58159_1 /TAXON_ID=283647 /ORGANISM="Mesodinium pulex, Strain SPMC105" /LENGTH=473 /DNA_ID=CAMNT_0004672563 /DNA_START=69 /DNA_END=1490 /DNA_ORIENTATION=+